MPFKTSAHFALNLLEPLNIDRLMNPRSVGVVGVSTSAGAIGSAVLENLDRFAYSGEVHLISRGRTEVNGRSCFSSIEDLPVNTDVVILGIPDHAVLESIQICSKKNVGAVVVFAAGFAETGVSGQAVQNEISRIAIENGLLVVGPNCLGLTNFVAGIPLTFGPATANPSGFEPTLAIVAQSGGMMGNQRLTHFARGLKISYSISTGNEAVVGIEDYLNFLIKDKHTSVIALFVEQIRRPQLFLKLLDDAKAAQKPVVLLHLGKSQGARESAASHTGALAGDFEVMATLVSSRKVVLVETMEELVDVSWLLTRFTQAPTGGVGVMTDSGALKGFALDFSESIGLNLPHLSQQSAQSLKKILPAFSTVSNPLDMTAQGLREMALYGQVAQEMLSDPGLGALSIVLMPGSPQTGLAKFRALHPVIENSGKAVTYTMMGGDSPLADELVEEVKQSGLPFFRSPERALRALKHVMAYNNSRNSNSRDLESSNVIFQITGQGLISEYASKNWLAIWGVQLPSGDLAQNISQANTIAKKIGYPAVLKAQSAKLPHKSDAGGVQLNIQNEEALELAWKCIHANVASTRPDLVLDGILVEAMVKPGVVEMVIGAKRDPQWGPILMVGLGGVWIEVLKDVRFMAADLNEKAIKQEILKLKGIQLLQGARGTLVADIDALVALVRQIGSIFCSNERLLELDINPLVVYEVGKGVLALDALLVLSDESPIGV